jgi:ribonuclease D
VTDPAVEVVMHAAGEDLRICRQRAGRLPGRVVDVQVAAGLAGLSYPLSLGNLVRSELGLSVPGGETRTDWRRRPLSDSQIRYALDDVRHLLDLADRLGARLAEWGRAGWAEAEYQSLVAAVADRHEDGDRWRRLPGLAQLSRRGLEAARRLDAWRRDEARRADRPFRQVLRDDLLVAIARRQPANRKDLEALRDFHRSHLLARSREVLVIIAEARAIPEDQLPAHGARHDDGPGLSMVVSLLNATLGQCCAEMRLAAPLVGTSGDLRELVRWHASGRDQAERPALLEGWRGAACGRVLLDVLSGRRALRIVDPTADVPVAVEPLDRDGSEPRR